MTATEMTTTEMTTTETDSPALSTDAATVYEELFVPALFGPWAEVVAGEADLRPGDWVLDVACGTGVLARAAAKRVAGGSVVGLDASEGMLAVAARTSPDIEWREGLAESLPFDDARFDVVVSQFGLMFFSDARQALREARRVLRPGGRAVFAVWASASDTPGYAAFIALLDRLFGASVAAGLQAPFSLGDPEQLGALFRDAGGSPRVETHSGVARFPDLETWIRADAEGWLQLDAAQHRLLLAEAREELGRFVMPEGAVQFEMPAYLVSVSFD